MELHHHTEINHGVKKQQYKETDVSLDHITDQDLFPLPREVLRFFKFVF